MNIEAIFEGIRSLYFPRWDRKREWTAMYGTAIQCRYNTGYCDSNAKTIYLDERSLDAMPIAGVQAILIHEVCHDVGAASHNREWAKRMESAAQRADDLGEFEVAEILRCDIFSYAGNGVLANYDLSDVLDYTEELISRNPGMDYAMAVKRIAKYFGHAPTKVERDFGCVIENVLSGVA